MSDETTENTDKGERNTQEENMLIANSADESSQMRSSQASFSDSTDQSAARSQANSKTSQGRVNWNNSELKRILSDYRKKGIGSTREVARQIAALTGISVSHSTICRQSRLQTGCNQWVPRRDMAAASSSHYNTVGIVAYRERRFNESEEGQDDASTSTQNGPIVTGADTGLRMSVRHSRNGPVRTPPTVPYYMSFSERFKQTSLTVHLNADEVRIYRHTSHSRDGRSIYFRCSRCDNINRKLRTGITPRIKMMDGLVVGDLFPEHHPRCMSMSLVAARALEIERRCRKDIINGMDPKEAWLKGRMAAIAESATLGSSVYGPGTVTAAFPDWERCRRLYCTLRGKTLRRRLKNEHSDPRRIAFNDPNRPDSHAPRNGVDDISQFDVSEPPRPKRPRFAYQREWNAETMYGGRGTDEEENRISNDDEVMEEDCDEDYIEELNDLDEQLYEEIVTEVNGKANGMDREEVVDYAPFESDQIATNISEDDSTLAITSEEVVVDMHDKRSFISKRRQNGSTVSLRGSNSVPSVSSTVTEAFTDVVIGNDERRTVPQRNEQAHYEEIQPMYNVKRTKLPQHLSADGRPRRLMRPSRRLSPMPTTSASSHIVLPAALKQSITSTSHRRFPNEYDVGESYWSNNYMQIITPGGLVSTNIKHEERFAHGEAPEKLRQIERLIAEYNVRSGDKLASILVRRNGHMKMYGSKTLIAASLKSSICQSLKTHVHSKAFFDADELVSLPLMKVHTESEIDVMHDAKMRPMLSDFIAQSHFPFVHSFNTTDVPTYWPTDVSYCDPNREDAKFINMARRPRYRVFNSVVEGQRHVLKCAYRHYSEFLQNNFHILHIPGLEGDLRVEFEGHSKTNRDDEHETAIIGPSTISPEKINEPPPVLQPFGMQENTVSEGAERALGNTVTERQDDFPIIQGARLRYATMLKDVKAIAEHVCNIQCKSECRAVALFADEHWNLVASGDKTLIAALLSSDINNCLKVSIAKELDKVSETVPFLEVFTVEAIDEMNETHAIEAVENAMSHMGFPYLDPYDGERPQYWPQEIPFRSPSSDNGRGILNRRSGINTPIQAAKILLRSIGWFHVEKVLNEKLKMNELASYRPSGLMAETTNDGEMRKSQKANVSSRGPFGESQSESRQLYLQRGQSPMKRQSAAQSNFLKVFCRCGGSEEISSRDCRYCDRCVRYYHVKCLPLTEMNGFLLCIKCLPS